MRHMPSHAHTCPYLKPEVTVPGLQSFACANDTHTFLVGIFVMSRSSCSSHGRGKHGRYVKSVQAEADMSRD